MNPSDLTPNNKKDLVQLWGAITTALGNPKGKSLYKERLFIIKDILDSKPADGNRLCKLSVEKLAELYASMSQDERRTLIFQPKTSWFNALTVENIIAVKLDVHKDIISMGRERTRIANEKKTKERRKAEGSELIPPQPDPNQAEYTLYEAIGIEHDTVSSNELISKPTAELIREQVLCSFKIGKLTETITGYDAEMARIRELRKIAVDELKACSGRHEEIQNTLVPQELMKASH